MNYEIIKVLGEIGVSLTLEELKKECDKLKEEKGATHLCYSIDIGFHIVREKMKKENYTDKLNELYIEELEYGCVPPSCKMEYIGINIFGLTTYDEGLVIILGNRMMEVIECIVNRKTFEYQNISQENYENYITMCNMPFLIYKLEWGTSIRGAWFDETKSYNIGNIEVPKGDIVEFFKQLIEWSKS
jgi:hypothetical protein